MDTRIQQEMKVNINRKSSYKDIDYSDDGPLPKKPVQMVSEKQHIEYVQEQTNVKKSSTQMVHEKQQVQEVLTEQKIQMVTEKRHIEYFKGQENLKRNSTEMVHGNQQLQQVFAEQRKTNTQGQNNPTGKSDHVEETHFHLTSPRLITLVMMGKFTDMSELKQIYINVDVDIVMISSKKKFKRYWTDDMENVR